MVMPGNLESLVSRPFKDEASEFHYSASPRLLVFLGKDAKNCISVIFVDLWGSFQAEIRGFCFRTRGKRTITLACVSVCVCFVKRKGVQLWVVFLFIQRL